MRRGDNTAAKTLFTRSNRAFSHKCIHVKNPFELASYLLIKKRLDRFKNLERCKAEKKWRTIENPLPVFITYFTSWINQDGELKFRKDI